MCCIHTGGYGEATSQSARDDMPPFNRPWAPVAMGDDISASSAPGRRITQSQTRREAPSPVPIPSSNEESNASEDDDVVLSSVRNAFCSFWFQILASTRPVVISDVSEMHLDFIQCCNCGWKTKPYLCDSGRRKKIKLGEMILMFDKCLTSTLDQLS